MLAPRKPDARLNGHCACILRYESSTVIYSASGRIRQTGAEEAGRWSTFPSMLTTNILGKPSESVSRYITVLLSALSHRTAEWYLRGKYISQKYSILFTRLSCWDHEYLHYEHVSLCAVPDVSNKVSTCLLSLHLTIILLQVAELIS